MVFFEVTVKRNIITAFMNGIIYHNYDEMLVVYFCKIIEIMKVKSQDVVSIIILKIWFVKESFLLLIIKKKNVLLIVIFVFYR